MLPKLEQFKAHYDSISVGKGLVGLEKKIIYAITTTDALEEEGYTNLESAIISAAKAMGTDYKKVYNLLQIPTVVTFDKNIKSYPKYIVTEFVLGLMKTLYKGSDQETIDKLLKSKND